MVDSLATAHLREAGKMLVCLSGTALVSSRKEEDDEEDTMFPFEKKRGLSSRRVGSAQNDLVDRKELC